ncbi:tetratricopeptide repeat protein [Gottfriedia luciferensis]|uniref:tetratricopeptide repeat protein n=1 Tax=Gottfriedia luciferensis TaxID=178774 RepID=UPI000B44B6FD|nr:hypothetical protein [Gottfriedia luciferensis]
MGKLKSQTGEINNSLLEQYKQVYEMYNQASRLIKEDNLDSAELILQEIFNEYKEIQIPIEIYKTYILLLLTNKKEKLAQQFLGNAPDEIKYAGEMLQIQQKYQLTLDEKPLKTKKLLSTKVIFSLIGGLVICFSVFGIVKSDLLTNKSNGKESQLQKQIKTLEDQNKTMKAQVNEAQKKLTEKESDATRKKEKMKADKEGNAATNILKPTNVVDQAVAAYNKGLELFKAKQYEEAIKEFKISYTLDSTNFSSDDALYYLIMSQLKINPKVNVDSYLTEFINQSNKSFKDSPYYDDVLILQAESFIKNHKIVEAKTILNDIVNHYGKEWTANKAKTLLKNLKE